MAYSAYSETKTLYTWTGYMQNGTYIGGDSVGKNARFDFDYTVTPSGRSATVSWKVYGRGRSSSPTWLVNNIELNVNGTASSGGTGSGGSLPSATGAKSFNNVQRTDKNGNNPMQGSFTINYPASGAAQSFTVSGQAQIYQYSEWVPFSITITLPAIESQGTVRIFDGSTWREAVPYIYDGSSWRQAIPYVYDGSSWRISG